MTSFFQPLGKGFSVVMSGLPLSHVMGIPKYLQSSLFSKVEDFIIKHNCSIPDCVLQLFSNLFPLFSQVPIPLEHSKDKLLWMNTDSGILSFKDSYLFQSSVGKKIAWAKLIWCKEISTNDMVATRGIYLPSMCSLCSCKQETRNNSTSFL